MVVFPHGNWFDLPTSHPCVRNMCIFFELPANPCSAGRDGKCPLPKRGGHFRYNGIGFFLLNEGSVEGKSTEMKRPYLTTFLTGCLLFGLLTPAHAIPVSFDFSGTLADGGGVTGSFTYENTESPLATNVRGLAPNATYALTNWNFAVTSGFVGSTTFSNDITGNSAEFCQGTCIFSSIPVSNLIFANADNLQMQLTFNPLSDPTPLTSPPANLSEWGGFNPQSQRSSFYRVPCPVCAPVALFQAGALTAAPVSVSIPGPSSFLFLACGLVGLAVWQWKKRSSALV